MPAAIRLNMLPGTRYRVCLSKDSGIAEASVDLVVVAQALHWFDLDGFFDECAFEGSGRYCNLILRSAPDLAQDRQYHRSFL
jgi:hypothetical protein